MPIFSYTLFDAPAALREDNDLPPCPSAAAFKGVEGLRPVCEMFGYIMLLGQELEQSLRDCLQQIRVAALITGKPVRFEGDDSSASFVDLISMFCSQLDLKDEGSRRLRSYLHRARKLRNDLTHYFFITAKVEELGTEGGRARLLERLGSVEQVFFPLVSLIHQIGQAYAAEYGLTKERVAGMVAEQRREQERMEAELEGLLDEDGDRQGDEKE